MELEAVRTGYDLQRWVEQNVPQNKWTGTLRDTVEWFVAYSEAGLLLDQMDRHEIAELFLKGLTPITANGEAVNEFIGSFFEDFDCSVECGDEPHVSQEILDQAVESFYLLLENHFQLSDEER